MTIEKTRCQIRKHCQGSGVIEVHVVAWRLLCCINCASGSDQPILTDDTKEALRPESGNYDRIHPASSTDHECEYSKRDHIHLSAMRPRANPRPGLAAPLPVGQTMCHKEYSPGDRSVVERHRKDEVTCPECLKGIAESSMAI